jgi:hypothetical protein
VVFLNSRVQAKALIDSGLGKTSRLVLGNAALPGIAVVSDSLPKLLNSCCLPSCRVFQSISGPEGLWLARGDWRLLWRVQCWAIPSFELSLKFVEKQMQVLRLRLAA